MAGVMMKMHNLISLILVFSLSAAQEPKSKEKDIFSQVPSQSRSELQKRLRLYIKYERQQEYGKLYDMFSETTKHPEYLKKVGGEYQTKTKDSYAQFRKSFYPKVLDFKPQWLNESHVGNYEIRGQATLRYKNMVKKEERILYVWLENGDWYFSELNEDMSERFVTEPTTVDQPKIIESLPPH